MKHLKMKLLFLLLCMSMVSSLHAQPAPPSAKADSTLASTVIPYIDSLVNNTRITAEHTKPDIILNKTWDYYFLWSFSVIAGLLAIPALIFELKTARMTKRTANNTKEINKQAQRKWFKDLIRHLYRNKVCVCAMQWKLAEEGFGNCYPSEEHLLKLKVLPEDLRLDRFDNYTSEHYDKLHKLELLFRNYSIEVDVTLEHLKQKALPDEVKISDLRTLEFKSQLITKTIYDLINGTGMQPIDEQEVRDLLLEEIKKQLQIEKEEHDPDKVPPREGKKYDYYDETLHLTEQLNKDISREYTVIKPIYFV
jgi:hypothetical protein